MAGKPGGGAQEEPVEIRGRIRIACVHEFKRNHLGVSEKKVIAHDPEGWFRPPGRSCVVVKLTIEEVLRDGELIGASKDGAGGGNQLGVMALKCLHDRADGGI